MISLLFALFLSTTDASACSNFTGRYIASMPNGSTEEMTVSQTNCASITVSSMPEAIIIDNRPHSVPTDPSEPDTRIRYTARWVGNDLVVQNEVQTPDADFSYVQTFHLEANHDITQMVDLTAPDGQHYQMVMTYTYQH